MTAPAVPAAPADLGLKDLSLKDLSLENLGLENLLASTGLYTFTTTFATPATTTLTTTAAAATVRLSPALQGVLGYDDAPATFADLVPAGGWEVLGAVLEGALATGRARLETGESIGFTQAGWHASCLPWLHERGVALIGADTPQDVQPSGYDDVLMPVHAVGLVAMGLWLLDNCDLEAAAAVAAELGQWDFQLAVAPVRLAGTSGSPVNPIATF